MDKTTDLSSYEKVWSDVFVQTQWIKHGNNRAKRKLRVMCLFKHNGYDMGTVELKENLE